MERVGGKSGRGEGILFFKNEKQGQRKGVGGQGCHTRHSRAATRVDRASFRGVPTSTPIKTRKKEKDKYTY